jgi:RNA polymerase sigma factor (sigma-70 family)
MQTTSHPSPVRTASDAELLARFAANADDPAFAELVRRYLPLVLAVTRRRLGGSGLAEDAAQQVFIALSRRIRTVRTIPCLAAWLQKAAVYEAANLDRSERRHRRRAEQAPGPWRADPAEAASRTLDEALAALPDKDRQILLLHHFEKRSYEQIATRLGITAAAAQRRGHRAMARLAERVKGGGRDEAACALWLGAGLALERGMVPVELAAKITAAKQSAALAVPWLPVAAALLLGGGTWAAVKATRTPPPPPATVATPAPETREPRTGRSFTPHTADDKLNSDVREFIARAKRDSRDAWEWVKQRPEGSFDFLQNAVRHLADRDLPAAERFLDVVEGSQPRQLTIGDILTSRASGNFEAAILWIDSFDDPQDRKAIDFGSCSYINSKHLHHDYAAALRLARSPEIRTWLIRQACARAAALDEAQIETLAASLQGDERRLALGQAASILLQRGDPRAFELLDEARPTADMFGELDKIALRDPRGLLDWITSQNDGVDRGSTAFYLWDLWGRRDAAAAAAWSDSLSQEDRFRFQVAYSLVPAVRRLSQQR